jgi:hypothetical protein
MIRRIIGYLVAGVGVLGVLFFRHYKGTIIPYPWIWLIVSILVVILGLGLVYFVGDSGISKEEEQYLDRLHNLYENGEQIIMTLENCEVRENNYYEQVIDDNANRRAIRAMLDSRIDREDEREYVEQCVIVHYYKKDKDKRMTSDVFPINADTLKSHIVRGKVILYIDRLDTKNYCFDLTSD